MAYRKEINEQLFVISGLLWFIHKCSCDPTELLPDCRKFVDRFYDDAQKAYKEILALAPDQSVRDIVRALEPFLETTRDMTRTDDLGIWEEKAKVISAAYPDYVFLITEEIPKKMNQRHKD